MAAISGSTVAQVAGLFLGGGAVSAFISLKKLRPEADRLVVDSAEVVLRMSTTQLEQTITRHSTEVAELRDEMRQMRDVQAQIAREASIALAQCNAERRELRAERDAERRDNAELRHRVDALEAEVAELLSRTPPQGTPPTDPGAAGQPTK